MNLKDDDGNFSCTLHDIPKYFSSNSRLIYHLFHRHKPVDIVEIHYNVEPLAQEAGREKFAAEYTMKRLRIKLIEINDDLNTQIDEAHQELNELYDHQYVKSFEGEKAIITEFGVK